MGNWGGPITAIAHSHMAMTVTAWKKLISSGFAFSACHRIITMFTA